MSRSTARADIAPRYKSALESASSRSVAELGLVNMNEKYSIELETSHKLWHTKYALLLGIFQLVHLIPRRDSYKAILNTSSILILIKLSFIHAQNGDLAAALL